MIPLGVLAGSRYVATGEGGVAVVDTFSGTESVDLISRTADTGQVWDTSSTGWNTYNNQAMAPSGVNVYAWIEYGSPDMVVSARLVYTGSGSARAGIMARYDPTAGTGYVTQVNTSTVYLYKFDGTDLTSIASAPLPMTHPTDIVLSVNGNALSVIADGTRVISTTDTTYSNGDYGGLFQVTTRSGNRYDDFAINAPWVSYENVPGIAAWFDASDLTTIQSSGGLVTQWDDKSGNGFHMTPASSQPTTGVESVNGLNALGMVGASLTNPAFNTPQPLTTFWVARLDSDLIATSPLHLGDSRFYMGRKDTTTRWNCWMTGGAEVSLSETITPGDVAINTARTDGATLTYRVGGGRKVGFDTSINGTIAPNGIATGTPNMGRTSGFTGAVCELLVFSRALTDHEILGIETDLMLRWGVL